MGRKVIFAELLDLKIDNNVERYEEVLNIGIT